MTKHAAPPLQRRQQTDQRLLPLAPSGDSAD
jgi:hypothetical protein